MACQPDDKHNALYCNSEECCAAAALGAAHADGALHYVDNTTEGPLRFDFLCHQVNAGSCKSEEVGGLARSMFQMHNHAQMDVPPDPGHVAVRGGVVEHMELGGGAVERQAVVNLCGQVLGGPPSTGMTPSQGMDDTKEARELYFSQGLVRLVEWLEGDLHPALQDNEQLGKTTIAFPRRIGCGIGGGDWDIYERLIEGFARDVRGLNVRVFIVGVNVLNTTQSAPATAEVRPRVVMHARARTHTIGA